MAARVGPLTVDNTSLRPGAYPAPQRHNATKTLLYALDRRKNRRGGWYVGGECNGVIEENIAGGPIGETGIAMDRSRSPLVEMRSRVSKTPLALPAYDAFEALVKDKLITWPKTSGERAAGFIMSVWASQVASKGRIRLPKNDLHWIVSAGKQCGRKLKGAESVWARELAAHLLRIGAKAESEAPPETSAQEASPG